MTENTSSASEEDSSTPRTQALLDRRRFLGSLAAGTALVTVPGSASGHWGKRSIDEIIAEMTLDEKIRMVKGNLGESVFRNGPIERLDVPAMEMTDGPLGVRHEPSTAFPATIAAASTFDPALIWKEGAAMGREAKAVGMDVLLAPATNINRVPVGGRTFEYYSEDPHLAGELAAAFAHGVQSVDVTATVKHFVANNQEQNRANVDVDVSERALREIYLPAFEAATMEGGAGAVMAAFNKVNGEYCSENRHLLREILKDEWGYEGFVMTDYAAAHDTVKAAQAGLDNTQPGISGVFGAPLKRAVEEGTVETSTIDEKIRRMLRQLKRTGALDGWGANHGAHGTQEQFDLAQRIAEDGSVLLKNEGDLLPLDASDIDSVALVGPEPDSYRIGGGGSSAVDPLRRIGPADGIRRVGDAVSVETVSSDPFRTVSASVLSPPDAHSENGLLGEYYSTPDWSGEPVVERVDSTVDLSTEQLQEIEGLSGEFSIRWTGTITAPADGTHVVALSSGGPSSLAIDGETVASVEDRGVFFQPATATAELELSERTTHEITVEVAGSGLGLTDTVVALDWDRPDVDPLGEAVSAAENADVAIPIVRGSMTEGSDKEDMTLAGNQNELVSRVAGVNENTVVLANTGGPVRMPRLSSVPSVLQIWYPGQESGTSVANLLFGNTNPSGKLPMTFGKRMSDYPADEQGEYPGVDDVVSYEEGVFVGYRHFEEQETEPLFPFGHGESYTEFEYEDLRVWPKSTVAEWGAFVSVDLTNTGDRVGAETVQLYVKDPNAPVDRPPKELKGFEKETIEPGETTTVTIELDEDAFHYWDSDAGEWTVADGEFTLLAGASASDVRAKTTVTVVGSRSELRPRDR